MRDRTPLPKFRHSPDTSYDLWDRASIREAKTSTSQKGRVCTSSGLTSKKRAARVLDFQVPLYRLRPKPAQRGMYWGRRLVTTPGLARKYAAANVGDSCAR